MIGIDLPSFFSTTVPLSAGDLVRNLEERSWVSGAADRLIWFDGDSQLKESFIRLVSDVVTAAPADVWRYLDGEIDVNGLLPSIVRCSLKYRSAVGRVHCLNALASMESAVDDAVTRHVEKMEPRQEWKILAFGGDSCYYEKNLGEQIARLRLGSAYTIYRYDPYAADRSPIAIDVDLDQGPVARGLTFDLIVCRWVLHHVPMEFRWGPFSSALRALSPSGATVIVEEGDLARHEERSPLSQAYRLFVACEDVLINGILRPEFVDANGSFHLNYLAEEDLESIESHLPPGMCRHVYIPGTPSKAGEIVLLHSQ